MTEADMARRDCKARSVLNKWKETENKALNGEGAEDDAAGESASGRELDLIGWRPNRVPCSKA